MDYQGNVIRPPSEAGSIILQVTVGCSHNKCTFCAAYKEVHFSIKDQEVIDRDLDYAARHYRHINKLFLADGDVLILPQHRLVNLLEKIHKQLPWIRRIRLYGNAKSILAKSVEQLIELKELGLDRIYMGLESGHDLTLTRINKWGNATRMIEAANRVQQASIFLSVTVLLGIAGKRHSEEHAKQTALVLNRMAPRQIAALTVMLVPGTLLHEQASKGDFELPSQQEMLKELRVMIANIDLTRTQFQANHASNYLPIDCRLNRDRTKVLGMIDLALAGQTPLMPEYMRGL